MAVAALPLTLSATSWATRLSFITPSTWKFCGFVSIPFRMSSLKVSVRSELLVRMPLEGDGWAMSCGRCMSFVNGSSSL